jgi:hypothetical protein
MGERIKGRLSWDMIAMPGERSNEFAELSPQATNKSWVLDMI